MPGRFKFRIRMHAIRTGALLFALSVGVTGCNQQRADNEYLVRSGSSAVTVAEFNQLMESVGEEVFAGDAQADPGALADLRIRVMNQLSEELMILERAKQLGLSISEAEIDAAVEAIKKDYPDNTFEETLLENAVSFAVWKKKLATRLLTEKVIAKELVDQVLITSEDVAAYVKTQFPKGLPEGEDIQTLNQRIVKHLRQQKAEQAYKDWIESLRQAHPLEINRRQWSRVAGKDAQIPE